jgi:hypothetical protein
MPENEHDRYLFETFKEFFAGWKEDIEDWKHEDENLIRVKLKNGKTYIFGDQGSDQWFLNEIKHPAAVRV